VFGATVNCDSKFMHRHSYPKPSEVKSLKTTSVAGADSPPVVQKVWQNAKLTAVDVALTMPLICPDWKLPVQLILKPSGVQCPSA
jgi:hypothetical protein